MSTLKDAERCLRRLPIALVVPSERNIRQLFDPVELERLCSSLRLHGQLHPVQVIQNQNGYEILEGNRRHRCLTMLGATEIEAIILPADLSEKDRKIFALMVNCRREGIHYLDHGDVLAELLSQHGWSQTQLAAEVDEPISTINKLLAIQKLDAQVKTLLRLQQIGFVKAWELTQLKTTEEQLARLSQPAISLGKTCKTSAAKRVVCPLGSGITVSVMGAALDYEGLLLSLEFVLKEARKYRSKGIDVGTLGKVFQDQVKQSERSL